MTSYSGGGTEIRSGELVWEAAKLPIIHAKRLHAKVKIVGAKAPLAPPPPFHRPWHHNTWHHYTWQDFVYVYGRRKRMQLSKLWSPHQIWKAYKRVTVSTSRHSLVPPLSPRDHTPMCTAGQGLGKWFMYLSVLCSTYNTWGLMGVGAYNTWGLMRVGAYNTWGLMGIGEEPTCDGTNLHTIP